MKRRNFEGILNGSRDYLVVVLVVAVSVSKGNDCVIVIQFQL